MQGFLSKTMVPVALTALLWSCAVEERHASEAPVLALTSADRQDITDAFFDAVCYCEAYLHFGVIQNANLVDGSAADCDGDERLAAYVAEHSDDAENRSACTALTSSPHVTLPDRIPDGYPAEHDDRLTNGCRFPDWYGHSDEFDPRPFGSPQPGPCRADFNYCVAMQLRTKAESLARAPASAASLQGILGESRERFQLAAIEYADAISRVAERCPSTDGTYSSQCDRLEGGYGTALVTRLTDAASQIQELVETETRNFMAAADAVTPGEVGARAYGRAVWGGDTGNEGGRLLAAQRLLGTGRPRDDEPTSLGVGRPDMLVNGTWVPDHRSLQLARLMTRYRIPSGHGRELFFGIAGWSDGDEEFRKAAYNLLDHKLSSVLRREPWPVPKDPITREEVPIPYADFIAFAEDSASLPEGRSPLRDVLGLRPGHMGPAMAYLDMVINGFDVDYTFHEVTGSPEVLFYALEINDGVLRTRGVADLGAALNAGRGIPVPGAFDATLPGPPVPALEMQLCSGSSSGAADQNWYRLDLQHLQDIGASGAAQVLRIALLALDSRASVSMDDAWLSESRQEVQNAIDLVSEYVGSGWSEYRFGRLADTTASSAALDPLDVVIEIPPGTTEPIDPPPTEPPPWDLPVYDPDRDGLWFAIGEEWPESGRPVFVAGGTAAYCYVFGHAPGAAPGTGCGWSELGDMPLLRTDSVFGFPRRGYMIPGVSAMPGPLTRFYVLWEQCEDGTCSYSVVDAVQPRVSTVHPWRGKFRDLLDRVVARDVNNPIAPAVSSLDLAYDLVPPLENSLIDDSDLIEDSWRHYLDQAEANAAYASGLLTEARAQEIELIRHRHATEAQYELAANAQREIVSAVCGADTAEATCDVEQIEAITLEELGLASLPPSLSGTADPTGYDPDHTGGPIDCEVFVRDFADYFNLPTPPPGGDLLSMIASRIGDPGDAFNAALESYVRGFLTDGLKCGRYVSLKTASETVLRGLPERVVRELRTGGDGNFSEVGGEVRNQYIELYRLFLDLKQSLQDFDRTFETAQMRVEVAAREAGSLATSSLDDLACSLGALTEGIGSIAQGASALTSGNPAGIASVVGGVSTLESGGEQCGAGNEAAANAAMLAFIDTMNAMDQLLELQHVSNMLILDVAKADNVFDGLRRQVAIGRDRQQIQQTLADFSSVAGEPSWRVTQALTARRARAALFRAQQRAFVARRALEFRLASDTRTMTVPEPFVDAPSTWTNAVFLLHTSTEREAPASGVYVSSAPEELTAYVRSLEDFVQGYPFARRFSDGRDTQILSLSRLTPLDLLDPGGAPGAIVDVDQPLSQRLFFKCSGHDGFLRGGRREGDPLSSLPCVAEGLGSVEYAVHSFYIPEPVSGYVADRLARNNFNYRVRSLALNIVGSAVTDCTVASRPDECYAGGNLQYSMRHEGEVSITNFENESVSFMMEPGVIEHARALAAERVLTNPLSSTDRALLDDYQRTEWWGRPLGGVYTVTIHGRPEIVWQNLEDIQILLTYDYWTRQE